MKKIIMWLISHLYVRTTDLQAPQDDMSQDEIKPHNTVEIGIRGTF